MIDVIMKIVALAFMVFALIATIFSTWQIATFCLAVAGCLSFLGMWIKEAKTL